MARSAAVPGSQEAGPLSNSAAQATTAFRFAFLQVLMNKGYMSDEEAKTLYNRICCAPDDSSYFGFLQNLNQHLSFAHFEARRIKNPIDQQEYIGFVNREADEQSKKSVKYRGNDGKPDVRYTAFFRAVASQGRHLGELGKREREVVLKQFVEDGWLAVPPGQAGRYTFGVRSLLELGEYILGLDLPAGTRDVLMKYL